VVGKQVELVVVEAAAAVMVLGWRRRRWWKDWAVEDKFLGEAPGRRL
jgi:hypothetical protein